MPAFVRLPGDPCHLFRVIVEVRQQRLGRGEARHQVEVAAQVSHAHQHLPLPALHRRRAQLLEPRQPRILRVIFQVNVLNSQIFARRPEPDAAGRVVQPRPHECRRHARSEDVHVEPGKCVAQVDLAFQFVFDAVDELLRRIRKIGTGGL